MKVGYYSDLNSGSGIGNYEQELYHELSENNEIIVDPVSTSSSKIPAIGKYITSTLNTKKDIKQIEDNYDIIHLPAQFQAGGLINNDIDAKTVVTVHDIIPYVAPDLTNILDNKFASVIIKGLKEADHIISISNHTKLDIIESTNIPEKNISVVYPSINKSWLNSPAHKNKLKKFGITEPYILYVGTQGKKKNIKTIIKCMNYIKKDENIQLVIAGKAGNSLQRLRSTYIMKKTGVKRKIVRTGFVDRPVLARLYHSACAFVFPTKYEGYGRPPLESMCAGTPVIASNRTAVPEILNGAAILTDPNEPKYWANIVNELVENDKKRERLVEKGYEQVDKYSWKCCASETLKVYEDLLSGTV